RTAHAPLARSPVSAGRGVVRGDSRGGGSSHAASPRDRMARDALPARRIARQSSLGALRGRRLFLRELAGTALAVRAAIDLALLRALVALAHVAVRPIQVRQ